jgi:hypothetical protein
LENFNQPSTSTKYIAENDTHSFFHFEDTEAMNMLHLNCRSLSKNFNGLQNLLHVISGKLTVIAVTETWLTADSKFTLNLPGYKFFSLSRTDKIGGGVGFFVCDEINVVTRRDLYRMNSYLECLFIELITDKSSYLLGCVYRPPNSDVALFNAEFLNILDLIDNECHCLTAILGDFNLDLIKNDNHVPTNEFFNNLLSHSFLPTIHNPTRISDSSATLIDNIFINKTQFTYDSAIIYNDISDHFPIAIHLENLTVKRKQIQPNRKTRSFDLNSLERFKVALDSFNWTEIDILTEEKKDPSGAYEYFHTRYTALFNSCFPEKTFKLSYKHTPRQPWMTEGLLKSCVRKSRLYKKYCQKKSPQCKNKYITYRNKLKSIMRRAELAYYRVQIRVRAGNLRLTWRLLNLVINKKENTDIVLTFTDNNKNISDKQEIAEKFNDFFTNIGSNLAKSIPNTATSIYAFLRGSPSNSFSLFSTDPSEIIRVVSKFPNKCSSGFDGIPMHIMKSSIDFIAEPISKMVNSSLQMGIFPDLLKIAKVCPVFKDGDPRLFTNYRPISILPSFSKIFEKIISDRLIAYLEKNRILSTNQFGFRKNHSTYMAIADMYDKISSAIDENKYSIGIFIDLSKAFDTIDHSILIKKLEHYGVRGIPLKLFMNYLTNRKQYVVYNNVSSGLSNICCGVPQGSILGPLLFILYVNDISNSSNILHFILFADDTNLFCSDYNIKDLVSTVNCELSKLCEWFRTNRLSLNIKKTNYILFGSKRKPGSSEDLKVCLDGAQIVRVEHTKFLGIFVDEKLNWQKHVTHVSQKISSSIGLLSRARKILPLYLLRVLYHAMVYPYLMYCNIVWGCASFQTLNSIIILQKRVIRIISGSPFRATTSPIFKRYKLLKFVDIRKVQAAMFMFRFKSGLLPEACQSYFCFSNPNRRYETRNVNLFQIPLSRTDVRKKSINVYGPEVWNELPIDLKMATSIYMLKRDLINQILSDYSK